MDAQADGSRGARFLVELTPPPGDDIRDLAERSRSACRELAGEGTGVRLLRSVFVPEDGTCLLVFEAVDAGAVGLVGARAGFRAERITPAIEASTIGRSAVDIEP
jgi:hypothetical protein